MHVPGKELVVADGLSRIAGRIERKSCSINADELPLPVLAIVAPAAEREEPTTEDAAREDALLSGWDKWLEDSWYLAIVRYKLTGNSAGAKAVTRAVKHAAKQFVLVEGEEKNVMYREKTGKLAQCCIRTEVDNILQQIHGAHGHFAAEISKRLAIGQVYWPERFKHIEEFCRSCPHCQNLGPLRPTRSVLPVLQLQPLDMIGIDYIGPISPISISGMRYIIVAVDYFSRFLWAKAVKQATSTNSLAFIQTEIVHHFGWPRTVYSDNGSHFVQGILPVELKRMDVRQFSAPIRHPASVGLAERYVQLILRGLRTTLQEDNRYIFMWDSFLENVVWAANSRAVRVHGFSPAELLMGMKPEYIRA